ncbi:hypothetical protein [Novipirellula artificiosorum]|uniref:Yip1 domain protein n=1 Tax=Novipirellula artificiosorum TaxID=2528016 RepID=A0A5C6E5X2_9BACT|nr:hypothetical protein [Novipirellula artificiosorum]TWU42529.1 hypothetical protein Poly41_08260 [Novipirellula artificiosorum]
MSNLPPNEPNPYLNDPNSGTAPAANPYAPSAQTSLNPGVGGEVEQIRRYHLNHEASVKSIGTLYMLGTIFMVPISLFMLASAGGGGLGPEERIVIAVLAMIYFGLGILQGFTAVGLWRLRPWARIVAIVLSVLGLLAIPIGTIISGYFLYLLVSEKGQTVFSPAYQDVIAQTPHIKYKTSLIVWILLGFLLLLILLGVAAAVFGG